MDLYHQFQKAITFANFIPFIQNYILKFEMIIQYSSQGGCIRNILHKSNEPLMLRVIR